MLSSARFFSLTLPSDLSMLSVVRTFLETVGQSCAIEKETLRAVIMASSEAVTNIVRHAHRHLDSAQIRMRVDLSTDTVAVVFQDQGKPFDLTTVPHLNPAELRIGGRGVYLMRALMDELSCEPCAAGECGNILRMVKHRQPSSPMRECG